MRITQYRTLRTYQDWGRLVGDANGVHADGIVDVQLVLVDTDEGITGVGIGPVAELASVFAAIDGEDPRATVALYDRMLRYAFKAGHSGVVFGTIGALDSALWDIKAKAAGQPLWRLLGGRDRALLAYGSALDFALSEDELATVYHAYAERGVRAAKLKGGLNVASDLTRLRLVRDVISEALPGVSPGLMLDANENWSSKQAVRYVGDLERHLDLIWVEEPVRRWDAEGMAALGRRVRASIAGGENLTGLEQFRPLLAVGALDVVQTAAVWGITHFLRVAALAHAYDRPVSPIGTTPIALLHAATAVPNHMVSELQDLTPPVGVALDLTVDDGHFILGESPGIGIAIDEAAIAALSRPVGNVVPQGPQILAERAGRRLDSEAPP
jgi:L-alanine-DL-glutamate epimerase-like enolase superfamily enzyme